VPIPDEHRNEADNQAGNNAYRIFDPERVNVSRAFEIRVDDVRNKGGSKKTEEPFASRKKIVLITRLILQIRGKQPRAEKIKKNRVKNDEEANRKGPLRNQRQAKLPPPEMNDPQQERGSPAQVQNRDLRSFGMLHKSRESIEQCCDAQTDDDGDDDFDVKVGPGWTAEDSYQRHRLIDNSPIAYSCR